MNSERFEALVHALERRSRRDPEGYRRRVLLLALAGYGYLALVLLLLAALLGAAVAGIAFAPAIGVKLALVVGAFLWTVLRAVWVPLPAPEGRALRPGEAPALARLVDDQRRAVRAPRVHEIQLTGDVNAGVVQVPRFGFLGGYRNYLRIGLPLLMATDVEQFRAILAHEFGHLSRGHARVANWIYRLRLGWGALADALARRRSRAAFLFAPFFRRFAPYFAAYSFPLARADEYEADAAAARATSPDTVAAALTAVEVAGSCVAERIWPAVVSRVADSPRVTGAPYQEMTAGIREALADAGAAREWVERALAATPDLDDTHPPFAARLEALGRPPRLELPAPSAAASHLLGDALPEIVREFDEGWRREVQPGWERRHGEIAASRARLAELDARAASGAELSPQDAYDRACLTEEFGPGAEAALEQWHTLHERLPAEPAVLMALGSRLLARADGSGTPLVERAMQLDEELAGEGCALLRDHCRREGRTREAHAWQDRLDQHGARLEEAARERDVVYASDRFEPHDLAPELVADLREALTAAGVRRAWLVRKRVKHLPGRPLFVCGVTIVPWWRLHTKAGVAAVTERLARELSFPGEAILLPLHGQSGALIRGIRGVRGARIL